MRGQLEKHFSKNWQEYVCFTGMLLIIFVAVYSKFNLNEWDMSYPFEYNGGDDMSMLVDAKLLTEQFWKTETSRLGAPYGTQFYDFPANMLYYTGLAIMKIFAVFTNNAVLTLNLTYLSIFFISGAVSYIVMRSLKINCWISSFMSAVFGVSPYMLARGIGHMVLTEAYFVPLSILLCFWVMEREDVFVFDRSFFKKKINYVVILCAFLIANNGIAYYQFFTCYILLVVGLSKWIKSKKIAGFIKSVSIIGLICLFMIISLMPMIIYSVINGPNNDVVARNGFYESELYGLKIIMLFLPRSGHGIFDNLIETYQSNTMALNFENISAYLGIVGIIGFVVLMIALFINRDSMIKKRLSMLSELNIMLLLLGTTSGFGTIFAFLISDKLRSYSRISIFIEYVCIIGIALVINELTKKKINNKKNVTAVAIVVCTFIICAISIWEVSNPAIKSYSEIKAEYDSDQKFVSDIEAAVPEGAMIYQFPYHRYPEGGAQNNMSDLHLFIGYVHSDNLRWSFGSVKGREGDAWNSNVGEMEYEEMVSYLRNEGFAGIYIDRRAYEESDFNELENRLETYIGESPLISDNGNLIFFKL